MVTHSRVDSIRSPSGVGVLGWEQNMADAGVYLYGSQTVQKGSIIFDPGVEVFG